MQVTERVLTIRPAEKHDTPIVRRLFGELHTFNAALDERFALAPGWERVLDEHQDHLRAAGHGLTLIAWNGTTPVGLLMLDGHTDSPLFRYRHWAEVLALYVAPAARGETIAEQLLEAGFAWVREHGYDRVQLHVTACNERARRFYARAGFRPVQEIWRRELGPVSGTPPVDAECESAYAQGHGLLATGQHRLVKDDPCRD